MVFQRFGSTTHAAAGGGRRPSFPLSLRLFIVLCIAPAGLVIAAETGQPDTAPAPAEKAEPPAPAAGAGGNETGQAAQSAPATAAATPSPPPPPAQTPAAEAAAANDAVATPPKVPSPPAAPSSSQATAMTPERPDLIEPAADGTVSVMVPAAGEAAPAAAKRPQPVTAAAAAATPPQAIQPATMAPPAAAPPPNAAATTAAAEAPSAAGQLLELAIKPLEGRSRPGEASPPTGDNLYARPLPLLEALQRSGDRSRRLWITQAYWKAAAGYAGLRFATEAVDRLELIAPGRGPHDRGLLDVAIAAARADLAEARNKLISEQQQLVDLIRLPISEPPPWPIDRPLTGPYETHFSAIFSTRPATGRVRAIDRMLPNRHAALEARAEAVLAADDAVARAEADHARGSRPIESVLAVHGQLRQQQRQFLATLESYNLDIAEYAMAVADITVPDQQFVSMLIASPLPWSAQPPATVVPANNLQPLVPQLVPTQ